MGTTHFKGNLDVGGNITVGSGTNSGSFKLPSLTTVQRTALTAEVGMHVYDSTLGYDMVYRGSGGWGATNGTASASLDASYNGGSTITVDAGAVTLTDSQTGTGGGLLITKSGIVTGTSAASVFHINSTGAHDTSGALKMLEISVGSETASGGVYGIEVDMNAHADHALYATQGSVTIYDGDFTVTSCGVTTANGFSVTTANTQGDGIIFNLDSITSGDAFVINCTTDAVAYLSIQTDDTAIWSINGTDVLQTVPLEINSGDANALLVEEADGTTSVFNIDASAGVGDTTVLITGASETVSGYNLAISSSITTGAVAYLDASSVTTGDALKIKVISGTMTAAGSAISVVDDTTEVFAVRDDGSIYSKATAEGTTAFQIVAGDMVISDGDFTVSGGDIEVTDSDGSEISSVDGTGTLLTLDNEGGVIASDAAVLKIDAGGAVASGGNLLRIAPTGTPNAGAIAVEVVGASKTCQMMYIDGDSTGVSVVGINGGGALTDGFGVVSISNDGNLAAGGCDLLLTLGGTPNADARAFEINGAGKNAIGMFIDVDSATDSMAQFNSGGAIADNKAVVEITADGTPAATGSNILRVDGSGLTDTNHSWLVEIDGHGKAVQGLYIDADPTTLSTAYMHTDGVIAADKAVLELNTEASASNADSAVLRVEQGAADGVATCVALKQDDVNIPFITFETTIGVGNALEAVGEKSNTPTHFIMVDIEGVGTRYISCGTIA